MPHTSRKYRKKDLHPKRIQITDADGWTHVANTNTLSTSSKSKSKSTTSKANARKPILTADGAADDPDEIFDPRKGPILLPAEAPSRLNQTDLRKQFDTHLATWQASVAWQQLRSALLNDVLLLPRNQNLEDIDNFVCIGLGSPSGFVQGGWVDRRSVALYQLAALVSIIDILKTGQHLSSSSSPAEKQPGNKHMRIIAQDPVFNTHDTQLLSSLGITVVNTPEGFESITNRTFLFAPGAERRHLQLILPSNPAMVFGGPLEEEPSLNVHISNDYSQNDDQTYINNNNNNNNNDSNDDNISTTAKSDTASIITRFAANARSVKIADFEPKPEAFWRMRIYWRDDQSEDERDDDR